MSNPNLLTGSEFLGSGPVAPHAGITASRTTEGYLRLVCASGHDRWVDLNASGLGFPGAASMTPGEMVTFSVEVMATSGVYNPGFHINAAIDKKWLDPEDVTATFTQVSFTAPWAGSTWDPWFYMAGAPGTYLFRRAQLERGSVATPWESDWSETEPDYVEGMVLYRTERITYSNGQTQYAPVTPVTSYQAAGQALTVAANLQALVDSGLMRVEKASNPPTPGKGLSWLVVDELTGTKGVGLRVANSAGTGWMSYQILAEDVLVVGPDGIIRLKNGVVTAEALAAKLALVSKLVAGPEDGFHTELDQTGAHFFSKLAGVASPVEMLRINTPGTDGDGDVFALANPNDLSELNASIDVAGAGSFQDLTVANVAAFEDVTVKGRTLDEILWGLPRGEVARGSVKAPAGKVLDSSSGAKGFDLAKLKFVAEPGRSYHIIANGPLLNVYKAEVGAVVTINGAAVDRARYLANGWSKADADVLWSLTGSVATEVEVGFRIQMYLSTATVHSEHVNIDISVQDVGPLLENAAEVVPLVGDNAPAPVLKQTYTKQYSSSWASSYYMSNNARNSFYSGKAVQGSYNGSSANNHYGLLGGFPSMVSDLSGATIKTVWVHVYFAHWYNNSGGVARIGYHNSTAGAPPASGGGIAYAGGYVGVATGKPGGAWVQLTGSQFTAWAAALKSGAARGLYVQAGGLGVAEYGYATSGKIEITYEK